MNKLNTISYYQGICVEGHRMTISSLQLDPISLLYDTVNLNLVFQNADILPACFEFDPDIGSKLLLILVLEHLTN